uniref:Fucolectin tachylectin-4 pentraxin-1 domain-containing protein n=1 Tax=Sinocyclocheilus anshuiensis TaxID=1608454 RepID=A0A671TD71_9TELE
MQCIFFSVSVIQHAFFVSKTYGIIFLPYIFFFFSILKTILVSPLCRNRASRGAVIQSSTSGDWFAEKAIDGNRGLQQLYTGCSSTLNQTNPWWRVDLPHIYRVSRVVVTNRNDCCTEQINGAEIRIGNSLENNGNNNPICAVIPDIPAGESYRYSCGGMEGRYVNLIIPGNMKILTLCEVEVFGKENIAINGKAVQSSTLPYEANKAIDNADLYCTHTETEANPWWRLDLMDLQVIQEVIVTNRIDCCFEQINGAEIRIGNSLENNGNNNPICAVISSIPAGVSSTYTCNGMEGRYVNLFIPGDTKYLTLCEVQVYEEGERGKHTEI